MLETQEWVLNGNSSSKISPQNTLDGIHLSVKLKSYRCINVLRTLIIITMKKGFIVISESSKLQKEKKTYTQLYLIESGIVKEHKTLHLSSHTGANVQGVYFLVGSYLE